MPHPMFVDWTVLLAAAFAAGVLNAIAGGGSFLTFPALVFVGIPPITANATSAIVVAPGYLGSTIGYRGELRALPRRRIVEESVIFAIGGAAGAVLLLLTPASLFSAIVPWLLLFATALFAVAPSLLRRRAAATAAPLPAAARLIPLAAVAVYGGYFNGGLGILLMALYSLTGTTDLNRANALKCLGSFVLSLLSVATFAIAGAIVWPQALVMMVAATAGGFGGARLARRLRPTTVRAIVITTGVVMSALFFARG